MIKYLICLCFLAFHCQVDATPSCPVIKIVNKTNVWNALDKATLAKAKTRCVQLYPQSPCIKVFIKKAANQYNVVCGKAGE